MLRQVVNASFFDGPSESDLGWVNLTETHIYDTGFTDGPGNAQEGDLLLCVVVDQGETYVLEADCDLLLQTFQLTGLKHGDSVSQLKHRDSGSQLKHRISVSQLKHGDSVSQLKHGDSVSQLKLRDSGSQLKHRDSVSQLKHRDSGSQLKGPEYRMFGWKMQNLKLKLKYESLVRNAMLKL